jgi:hypothetical protein
MPHNITLQRDSDVHLVIHSPDTSDFVPLRHCTHLRTIQRLEDIMFPAVLSAVLSCLMALPVWSELSTSIKQSDHYLAPVTYLNLLGHGPNGYEVFFHPNHTLEKHFEFIGQDLSKGPSSWVFTRELFGYFALIDNQLRDEKIRRDPGVRWLETELEMLDWVVYDSQEDLCEGRTGSGCDTTALYTDLDSA